MGIYIVYEPADLQVKRPQLQKHFPLLHSPHPISERVNALETEEGTKFNWNDQ